MPIQVNLPCVDWPFYFGLSEPAGKENKNFLGFSKNFPVCYAKKFWYYEEVRNQPHSNLDEER